MLKKAVKRDSKKIFEYLKKEESINTTILSYLENYGLERDFQEYWIQYDNNRIIAVVMRHFNSLYIFCDGYSFRSEELGHFISFIGTDTVWGKLDFLSEIAPYLDDMVLEPSFHMILETDKMLMLSSEVKKAGFEDCRELASLIYSVPEFARFYHSQDEIERGIRRRMELGICRYFVLKRDGLIVSQAYTTIESSKYATIGGVVTRAEFRKHGLASEIVSCICRNILLDKKIPNLFYTNEEAGRIYRKLGFEPAGDYAMLLLPGYDN